MVRGTTSLGRKRKKMKKASHKNRAVELKVRGNIHTQLATDNVILTFVGGWVFTCDVILVAV